jgi:hypothetical protein
VSQGRFCWFMPKPCPPWAYRCNSAGFWAAAGANHDPRAVRAPGGRLEDRQRRLGHVEDHARRPGLEFEGPLGVLPVFRPGRRPILQTDHLFRGTVRRGSQGQDRPQHRQRETLHGYLPDQGLDLDVHYSGIVGPAPGFFQTAAANTEIVSRNPRGIPGTSRQIGLIRFTRTCGPGRSRPSGVLPPAPGIAAGG